jgi:hypothetical protein
LNVVVALAALLVVSGLVWAMKHYTTPADLTAERAVERAKNLVDMHTALKAEEGYGWVDASKGVVRLPIERAMELTIVAWQNPVQARADLNERVEKATYVPPPPPEQPSEFE